MLFITLPLWRKANNGYNDIEVDKGAEPHKLSELIKMGGAKEVLITFFCYCALEAMSGLWGSSYLVKIRGINVEVAAKIVSLFYFDITLGRFFSGFLTMKFDNKALIRIGQGTILLGIIITVLPFGYITLVTGFTLIGLGCAPIYPSIIQETPRRFGKELSQAFIGIQMAFAYMGSTFIPPLFGFVADNSTLGIFPIFLFIILGIMALSSEILNKQASKG